jgi:conflict system pore-forming effector with SLATT domain
MTRDHTKDLRPRIFEGLSWEPEKVADSLQRVLAYAVGQAEEAISWYQREKPPKWQAARWLRVAAILSAAIAGTIPILAQIYTTNGVPDFAPAWASVMLALAGTLVLLDRFFGFSTAWMRFVITEMRIRKALDDFQFDWELERAAWKSGRPNDEQLQRMLGRAKTFVAELNTLVESETALWVEEFQSTLKVVDEAVKAKAEAAALGGVNVTVTNGEQCDHGWQLSIDDGPERTYTGKSAAVAGLTATTHAISVRGTIGGNLKRSEALVTIAAGGAPKVELTLS